uniref:Mitochondrial carnitine/acylcarnitine carrier protein n=1 Tax=Globisporangium ultimum (strain ATCC 200006 / CBS 805.95 / DAOM BR144) TaxID=431595 RepID=K3W6I8_GLOUD
MEWIDVLKDLNAGTVGGVAGIIAGHPLDTVKVRLQTADTVRTPSVLHTLRHIVAAEGPQGLYKGLLSPILSNAPINAVVFGVQGVVARAIKDAKNVDKLSPTQSLLAGAAAGLVQTGIAAPSEHVKIQLQVNQGTTKQLSTIECGKQLLRQHGMKGLFRGWEVCLLRDMPAFGLYFFTYEVTKEWLTKGDPENETDMKLLLSGGIAGSASWLVTQPVDVVKSCVQSQTFVNERSAWQLTKAHYASEGAHYFLKGFGATMLRAFPVSAVTFLVYEKTMQFMS